MGRKPNYNYEKRQKELKKQKKKQEKLEKKLARKADKDGDELDGDDEAGGEEE